MEATTDTCTVCNDKQSHWKLTRTSDQQPICMTCYNRAAHAEGRGDISTEQARNAKRVEDEYGNHIDSVCLAIRRIAEYLKKPKEHIHEQIRDLEQDIALRDYNKARCVLTPAEHLQVLKEILELTIVREAAAVNLHAKNGKAAAEMRQEYTQAFKQTGLPKYEERIAPVASGYAGYDDTRELTEDDVTP